MFADLLEAYRDPMFWWFPVGTTLFSMAVFALFAGPLTYLAWRDPERLRRYRIQRKRPGPAAARVGASVGRWVVNNAIVLVGVIVLWPLLRHVGIHRGPLPAWWLIVVQVVFFVYLDDFLFYWAHRALHGPVLFRRIHAVHHRIMTPWAVTGHYMHPVEYVVIASLMLVGPIAVQANLVVLWIWIAWRQWEAAEGHCGYEFPWSPTRLVPGNDGAIFHDVHHARVKGNYAGFLAIWDGLLRTYSRGYRAEVAERHPVLARVDA